MDYNITDDFEEKGFIDKNKLLEYVTEEEVYEMVFGFKPKEFDYVTSPFRQDKNAGCWFERDLTGELKFKDFGSNGKVINGIRLINTNCFNAVQIYFNLSNFYKTLEFIKAKLIDGRDVKHKILHLKPSVSRVKIIKKQIKIYVATRNFINNDRIFWSAYGISKKQLIQDKVFPVTKFKIINTKSGDISTRVRDICYVYTEFEEGRKKLYRPKQQGNKRFLTNCVANDIGGIKQLTPFGKQLIISKSYKDYRVLKNMGLNVIWLQNEGMFPSENMLKPIMEKFQRVIIFFDNDAPGIQAANKLSELINSWIENKSKVMYLPEKLGEEGVSDPSDLYKEKGENTLKQFLKYKKLI